jgi:hypothetical protein
MQISIVYCSLVIAPKAKSKYNNWLIAKLINIFADVEEKKEREESSALMQAISWAWKHRY